MLTPSQDSPSTTNTLRLRANEQAVMHQIQAERLELAQFNSDEAVTSWQKLPLRMGEWSSTLESEICSFLW